MSDSNKKQPTRKKRISPVTVTIELTFQKVNENGTFSQAEGKVLKHSVKDGGDIFLALPWQSGGAIYVKTLDLKGIKVLGDDGEDGGEKQQKKKLF